MTATDYLDAVERRFLGDARFVSALVLSPRPGAYVGVARTIAGAALHQTAEQATAEDAARELARIAGASKHAGDAGLAARFSRSRDGERAYLHTGAGCVPGADLLDALAHALVHARRSLANRARLREMHADAACVCGGDDDAGHSWACGRKWCERGGWQL